MILDISNISEHTLQCLKQIINDNYTTQNLQLELAQNLIQHFKNLNDEDISAFTQLEIQIVQSLK